jgi:hypothetical protein
MSKKSTNIHEHPIYRAFGLYFPAPFVAKTPTGEEMIFTDAGQYYWLKASANPDFREKVLKGLNSLNVGKYWATARGLEKLGASIHSKWESIKEDRFTKAMRLKFDFNPGLKKLLKDWNPKTEPLHDAYARKGEPDLMAVLLELRKGYATK